MAADLEIFKRLYLFSLTSHGLITGLADFSFTERCYWYLQSVLNPCLTPAPLSVEKPDSVGQPSLIFYFQPEVMFLSKWLTFGEVAVL